MRLRMVGEVTRIRPMAVVGVVVIDPVDGMRMGARAVAARLRDQRHHRGRDQHECDQHRQEPPDPPIPMT